MVKSKYKQAASPLPKHTTVVEGADSLLILYLLI